ncbi:MAG: PEP-CTERM sorting domain-containing protein, partial [Puniceicoccales bacterium]|nr:PEP-CTERM sorting domain-containing protein [Puniceicoccales bacterium]
QRINLNAGNSDDYFAGVYWKDIASDILIQGGQVTVNLSTNEAGKFVIADGLRLEFIQAIPEPSTYVFTGALAALGLALVACRRRRNR